MAKCVNFWQIPRLFHGNLQISLKKEVNVEITIHYFLRDRGIAEFWRAWIFIKCW